MGGIWQQFSVPENVQLSLFSINFLRNINVCTVRFKKLGGEPFLSIKSRSLAGKGNQGYVVLEAARPCDPCPRERFVLMWGIDPGSCSEKARGHPFPSASLESSFSSQHRNTWL